MRIHGTLVLFALFAGSCISLQPLPAQYADWTSGDLTLTDSTVVRFADITGMFVFFAGGKGGVHGRTFPVKTDTGWVETNWKEIKSVEILQSRYGKIERWPCLLNPLVSVALKNGVQVRYLLDCLFWIEVTLQVDQEGKLNSRTFRFFTPIGELNIRKIERD